MLGLRTFTLASRDAGISTAGRAAGRFALASGGLLALSVLVFIFVGAFGPHGETAGSHVDLLDSIRLVLALPFLLLFGVVSSSSYGLSQSLRLAASAVAALMTLHFAVEAAVVLHGPSPAAESAELGVNGMLVLAISTLLYTTTQSARRSKAQETIARRRDALTGLLNRDGILAAFDAIRSSVTLAMLDLNDLKIINDLSGHAEGDARLQEVARSLASTLPPNAVAGRWGGDEFVILFPDTPLDDALNAIEALNARLPRVRPGLPAFAFGAATVPGGSAFDRALALADAQMYDCKERQHEREGLTTGERAVRSFEEFSARIEEIDDPTEVARVGLSMARQLLGFSHAVYYQLRQGVCHLAASDGELPLALQDVFTDIPLDRLRGLTKEAVAAGRPVWTDDYTTHPCPYPALLEAGMRSAVVVPITTNRGVEGSLGFTQFRTWRPITPQVRRVVETLALRIRHAIEMQRAVDETRRTLEGGLLGLGLALEYRDFETAGHTERVVVLAMRLADALELPAIEREGLRQGAYLHDIGKLAVPDAILLKPGRLSDEEWLTMKLHTLRGHEIASQIPAIRPDALSVILHHHERWDGKGYPHGLAGEEIPLVARIFAVCDVYDALTCVRPYKPAWTQAAALAELERQAGAQFDPAVVAAFLGIVRLETATAEPALALAPR